MATAEHVNGPAEIKVGTGSAGALELLGHSLEGVELDWQDVRDPVYADTGGGPGMLPIDFQEFGEVCVISAQVIVYDESVLAKLRTRPGSGVEGLLGVPGQFLGPNSYLRRLLVTSPFEALPWNFPTGFLRRKPIRLGTRRSIWGFEWFAFAYIGAASSGSGAALYNRTTS